MEFKNIIFNIIRQQAENEVSFPPQGVDIFMIEGEMINQYKENEYPDLQKIQEILDELLRDGLIVQINSIPTSTYTISK